tara:strand:- start:17869 stop:18438 length:570 start_codon:yes stop_codon:yes gene_type:complete
MVKANSMEIWTIGHSNLQLDDFVALLQQHNIELVGDIRRFPGSRKFPHFGQEPLSESLQSQGINYRWLEGLGGRRSQQDATSPSPNDGLRNQSFRNYADYMLTETFREAFAELKQIAAAKRTAIMCSESVFWRCHRRLVSDYTVASGGTVHHIFPDGKTRPHALTNEAVIKNSSDSPQVIYPGAPTLFD